MKKIIVAGLFLMASCSPKSTIPMTTFQKEARAFDKKHHKQPIKGISIAIFAGIVIGLHINQEVRDH